MSRIKSIPTGDRPREKFLAKGPDALSKSDLLAILLGSGIKGTNVQQLARGIIQKCGKNFLDVSVDDLVSMPGIGEAKALQIVAAISLVKRFYADGQADSAAIRGIQDVIAITSEFRTKKKEHLVCLYLDARNVLLKKEVVSVGLVDKALLHPREIFSPAVEVNSSGVILVHNHPSGDPSPSDSDVAMVEKISQAGEVMGISVIDFAIIAEKGHYSFYEVLKGRSAVDYVAEGQGELFGLLQREKPQYIASQQKSETTGFRFPRVKKGHFQLHNRRYIGSKYKLIEWLFSTIQECCEGKSFMDIFSGTGIVAATASQLYDKVVVNDFLFSNEAIYKAFFGTGCWNEAKITAIIGSYNDLNGEDLEENYFSSNFGDKYFSRNSAKVIGFVRENIEENRQNLTEREYYVLLASLLYSVDKIANTVGHYDAYFKKDLVDDRFFMRPIAPNGGKNFHIYREDANLLARKVAADIVYVDPPYNSRQYSRFYHVLETLTKWDKPTLHGVALKPNPENMSDYCRVGAKTKLAELIADIQAKFVIVSYNNTYESKSKSSRNRITLHDIESILSEKGRIQVFEKSYRHFNAGNTNFLDHKEYLFVTGVKP